jgi:rhodanese-related sulfurtransferase
MKTLSVNELHAWLNDEARPAPWILDVREVSERQKAAFPGSHDIPMDELSQRLNDLPEHQTIVTLCHHGVRSAHVASYLTQLGFEDVYNLQGGIDAWAKSIDPSLARY